MASAWRKSSGGASVRKRPGAVALRFARLEAENSNPSKAMPCFYMFLLNLQINISSC